MVDTHNNMTSSSSAHVFLPPEYYGLFDKPYATANAFRFNCCDKSCAKLHKSVLVRQFLKVFNEMTDDEPLESQ